jgi:alpha-mannosidase
MTAEALNGISSKVKTNTDKGIPVMVFNSLSWQRDDPVSFTMNFMQGRASGIKVLMLQA